MIDVNAILKKAEDVGASDVHFISGLKPIIRVYRELVTINEAEEISKDDDLMEAVEKIKDATFDINTIGLYDAELDRKWKEEAKMAYAKKLGIEEGQEKGREEGREEGQFSIISTMLKNGITPKKVIEMTGISLEKIKKMGLL